MSSWLAVSAGRSYQQRNNRYQNNGNYDNEQSATPQQGHDRSRNKNGRQQSGVQNQSDIVRESARSAASGVCSGSRRGMIGTEHRHFARTPFGKMYSHFSTADGRCQSISGRVCRFCESYYPMYGNTPSNLWKLYTPQFREQKNRGPDEPITEAAISILRSHRVLGPRAANKSIRILRRRVRRIIHPARSEVSQAGIASRGAERSENLFIPKVQWPFGINQPRYTAIQPRYVS